MAKKKSLKTRIVEYMDKYSNISKDFNERFLSLLISLNLSKREYKKLDEEVNRLQKLKKAKKEEYSFIIYLHPQATDRAKQGTGRPIKGKEGKKRFYVSDAKDNRELFEAFAKEHLELKDKIITPCEMYIDAYFATPATFSKVEKVLAELQLVRNVSRPDVDNVAKTYQDMIQGTLLADDSLINLLVMRKLYSCKPRIEVTIKYLSEIDTKSNYDKIKKWKSVESELIEERWKK